MKIWLAPGTVNWCTERLLKETKRIADEEKTGIMIHAGETLSEHKYSVEKRGLPEIAYMEKIGVLDRNVLVVHAVWTDEREIEYLWKRGAKVSHNPISNMYLSSGVAPIPEMLDKNITVGLATDGAASNGNEDMFDVLRVTPLLHKVHNKNPASMTAEKTLEMATIKGAKALMMDKYIGSIEKGKKADLIILNMKLPNVTPVIHYPSAIVYSASSENVDTTIVNGKVLMKERKLTSMKEEKVLDEARRAAERIIKSTNYKPSGKWIYT